ncbi:MAG: ATP-binding cassette domain-containing protein [Acidobacteriota bacterium]|nr:ATP-binding cassette domain-containing protein [Acidobacteriota bacterium]
MGGPPILRVENATVYRGDTRVFDALDLVIPTGRSTAVLGPNGAGKSTLLQLVTRDLYPVARPETRVEVLGRSRWHVYELRQHLGIVSQELHLRYQRDASGLDVALSGLYASIGIHSNHAPSEADRALAASWLERLGAGHLAERAITAMSAGEQRRCLLARALINDPDTLLLDEPTVSLDLAAAFDLLRDLRGQLNRGRRLVLVTHHLQEIPPEVSWVVLLKAGSVLAEGPKVEMVTSARLSELFDVRLQVIERDGYYQVFPA